MNALLTALVNGALMSVPLTLAVWLVLRLGLGRVLNAATRYAVWWATLAAVMALPLIYLPARAPSRSAPAVLIPPIRTSVAPQPTATAPRAVAAPRNLPPAADPAPIPPARAATAPAPKPAGRIRIAASWTRFALAAWMASAAILLTRLAVGWLLLARSAARAVDCGPEFAARSARWMAKVGSRRRVRIAGSAEVPTPVAIGPWRPTVLFPIGMLEALEDAEIEQIGVHESAHLARWDDCALLAERTVEALFAWHPVVRWIARQIDLEREIACDDNVIASLGRPHSYATCLTRVVELSGDVGSIAAAAAADDRSHLALRIARLLDRTGHTGTRLLASRLAPMLAALAGLAWASSQTPGLVAFVGPLVRAVRTAPERVLARPMLALTAQAQENAAGFRGRVIEDSSGSPVASAELRFHKSGWRELAADLETGRDGQARALGLDAGDYTVDISKPNFVTATLDVRLPDEQFLVRLVRYGVITGSVRNMQGKAEPARVLDNGFTTGSTRVCLLEKSRADGPLRLVAETEPESDGQYRLHDIPPGEYAVGVFYHGLPDGSGVQVFPDSAHPRFFSFGGGEEYPDVNFTVVPGNSYQVSGRVSLAGKKKKYAMALSLPEQPALPVAKTTTQDDGSFRFEKVPPGVYDLFAAGPTTGYGAYDSTLGPDVLFGRSRVQVIAQDVSGLEIAVSAGRSLPVVLRGQGNRAAPEGCAREAIIRAIPLEPWGILWQHVSVSASIGKETALPALPPGRFRLEASDLGANCYQVEQPTADLSGGATNTVSTVAVELAPAGSLRGVLKPAVTGYVVVLLEADASVESSARLASVDAQGRFGFSGLRPGRYRVAARPLNGSKERWVGDLGSMTEIEIAGGATADLELPVPVAGGAR